MLLLLFRAGEERFGLETPAVVEVTPVPVLRPVPSAPDYVAGLFDYRRTIVPVIDLPALLCGRAARMLMSTRVAVVRYGEDHLLGLLVENATETLVCQAEDFKAPGIRVDEAPYLGDVLRTPDGMVQRITVERLLPAHVRERLFEAHD
jgi:chemotaxis-related protein WspB